LAIQELIPISGGHMTAIRRRYKSHRVWSIQVWSKSEIQSQQAVVDRSSVAKTRHCSSMYNYWLKIDAPHRLSIYIFLII